MLQADPGRSYFVHKNEIDAAVQRVLSSGWYILGKECQQFEEAFADYIGAEYCIGVANGTDALELILRGLHIGAGDKVVTVGNTAVATVSAIERAGATVRFVDIEPEYYTMAPESLEEILNKENGVKAVITVHLFGGAVDMEKILSITQTHGVYLIEDCAQAHGTMYQGRKCGSFGIAAGFSFYPTKNLGAFGDGGAIVTSDKTLYERISALRQYGWTKRYISEFSGINSRLDEMQAAILSVKLKHLDNAIGKRRIVADEYNKALGECKSISLPIRRDGSEHSYHQYVIQTSYRDELMVYLKDRNIGTTIHYPVVIPQQKGYQQIPLIVPLANTVKVNDRILSLPMYPELTGKEVAEICGTIVSFFK